MNRRQLLGMIGLGAPIVAAGVGAPVAATVLMVKSKEQKDIESKMEGNHQIALTRTYGEIDNRPKPYSTFLISNGPRYIPGTTKDVAVFLNVGPDGHLYAKTNGQWNKIA